MLGNLVGFMITTNWCSDNRSCPRFWIRVECFDRLVEPVVVLCFCFCQIELQEATAHLGVYNETCRDLLGLLTAMLSQPWGGEHTCDQEADITSCSQCEVSALWHQLASKVMTFVAPRDELKLPVKDLPKVDQPKGKLYGLLLYWWLQPPPPNDLPVSPEIKALPCSSLLA